MTLVFVNSKLLLKKNFFILKKKLYRIKFENKCHKCHSVTPRPEKGYCKLQSITTSSLWLQSTKILIYFELQMIFTIFLIPWWKLKWSMRPAFFTMIYNLSSEMSDESNHGLRLVGQSSHTAVAYNAQSLDGSKVSVFNAFTHQCLVKEIATITIGRLSSKIPKSPLRNQAILLCFFSTASLYNGLLVLKTKEKHTFLKNFWILFQERKKTAFGFRNFALEMKEQREHPPN